MDTLMPGIKTHLTWSKRSVAFDRQAIYLVDLCLSLEIIKLASKAGYKRDKSSF